ncbi:ArsO family NAD(P)H-dependent flavin-containing monooxygenase [Nocardioides aurantiacus]|uniref:ArsO family NAD(P)H-dependent flavin-containing monooxygenase n=1 Tax=Nocardioides aurantiacus TaxID=86796 RepID=UPI000F487CA0|nr:ArsO family NAD(P)H-dependent flavin-containing monooxygenase [Nocardioides aurantiacus]
MAGRTQHLEVPVVVVGAGQAGLAVGYHLQRLGRVPRQDFLLLDAADRPGGAWPRTWDGLHLFSPPAYSSLPGWMMPPWRDPTGVHDGYPPRDHVVAYLTAYEQRYGLAPLRPHRVSEVVAADDDAGGPLLVRAPGLAVRARVVVSATGTWDRPFRPAYPGSGLYAGRQLHAADLRSPEELAGQRVVVVGGGNSAAQLLALVSRVADTTWVATRPPRFLPDDVDGRALFDAATARVRAREGGTPHDGVGGLGDVVVVPEVREARDRGVLHARPMFERLTRDGVAWADGTTERADVVLWCTGFRPALRHLAPLRLRDADGRVPVGGTSGTRAERDHRVHLVGYGDWTGPASATLIGVGRTARATVAEVVGRTWPQPA